MESAIRVLIQLALAEDIGMGDMTASYFVPAGRLARARIVARSGGVLSGTDVAWKVFKEVDGSLEIEMLHHGGDHVPAGAVVMEITGPARSILTAERTALNFMQRLSGVATLTSRYVALVAGTKARILDTRKTTPAYRLLEKRAVRDGGGVNHRMGLYDRAVVKDNHLVAEGDIGSIRHAIDLLKADHPAVEVELEADRLDQVEAFLGLKGVDHILLDNMPPDLLRQAVAMRGDRAVPKLEASGGVNLETVREIAETGVDFISVGALTHSAPALDLAMDFVPIGG